MEYLRISAVLLYFCIVPRTTGSVVLTQTHPAAPYVCRTGNITLRCQYDGVENVLGVVWDIGSHGVENVVTVFWVIGTDTTANPSTIPGHTALPRTTTYQEVVVDSYTNLRERYQCAPGLANGSVVNGNMYEPQIEAAGVTLSSLILASRTATTLSVTWSAGYPKCYSFTVSHSTQDGSINVTQPADSDTSHTLTSLRPDTIYRIKVEAVRKGDGADGQRAKVMGNFTTESSVTPAPVTSETVIPTATSASLTPRPTASAETAAVACTCPQLTVTVTVLSVLLSLVSTLSLSTCAVSAVVVAVMYKRLQSCGAELRGVGGDSVKAGPEGEGPPTREEEEEEGETMQANPAYLPIEMSYKSQESKYINVPS